MYKQIKSSFNDILQNSEYTKEAYIYGFKVIFLNFLTIISILMVSKICFKDIWIGIFFLIFFVPLRVLIGGYHCKKPYTCIISFSIIYYMTIYVIQNYNMLFLYKYFYILIGLYIIISVYKQSIKRNCKILALAYLIVMMLVWNFLVYNLQILIFSAIFVNFLLFLIKEIFIKLNR